jgi:hypothetical protein
MPVTSEYFARLVAMADPIRQSAEPLARRKARPDLSGKIEGVAFTLVSRKITSPNKLRYALTDGPKG